MNKLLLIFACESNHMRSKMRTPEDPVEVDFSVNGSYFGSDSCFCAIAENHVVEVVVAYPVVYLVAMVVVAASDCISLHCVDAISE